MKTFLSTLAITLAITFTAAPADALDDLAKCRVYNAKIKMNYAKCLELDKLLVEKGKAPKGTCESKRTASLGKAVAKFVTKLGVNADDCRIGVAPRTADQVLQLFGAGAALTESQLNTLSSNSTIETIAAAAEQTGCEAAGGTWDGLTCNAGAAGYNCTIGAMCSAWAASYPEQLPYYINDYVDDTALTGGCSDDLVANRAWIYGSNIAAQLDIHLAWSPFMSLSSEAVVTYYLMLSCGVVTVSTPVSD
jgi:hypothetical protein